jgi:hypothetical protein
MEHIFIKIFRLLKIMTFLVILGLDVQAQNMLKFDYNFLGGKELFIMDLKPNKEVKQVVYHQKQPIDDYYIDYYKKPIDFELHCYAGKSMGHKPYLFMGKQKFIFDDIAGNNEEYFIQTCGFTPYYFSFQKRTFLLFVIHQAANGNYVDYLLILFDITQLQKPKVVLSMYDASISPECFGDFNGDGYLDFAHRNNGGTKLECYSLYKDKFKKLDNIELTLTGREGNLQIDLSKSKWFFDLLKK